MFEMHPGHGPAYDERMIAPMRRELTEAGFEELRSAADVERVLGETRGTVFAVVNSVCGCAAGTARPGIVRALAESDRRPARLVTVFAGQDREATAALRERLAGNPPSSPSVALFLDGKPVYYLGRGSIQGRMPEEICAEIKSALATYCPPGGAR